MITLCQNYLCEPHLMNSTMRPRRIAACCYMRPELWNWPWLSHGSANQQAGLFLLQRNSAEG